MLTRHLHDRELIAADARNQIRLPDTQPQAAGGFANEKIARRVPKRVIDRLEMIEVEHEYIERTASMPPRLGHGTSDMLAEQQPVRQLRQPVVMGLVGNFRDRGNELPFACRPEPDGDRDDDCRSNVYRQINLGVLARVPKDFRLGNRDRRDERQAVNLSIGHQSFNPVE